MPPDGRWARPDSNRRPGVCETPVITTRPRARPLLRSARRLQKLLTVSFAAPSPCFPCPPSPCLPFCDGLLSGQRSHGNLNRLRSAGSVAHQGHRDPHRITHKAQVRLELPGQRPPAFLGQPCLEAGGEILPAREGLIDRAHLLKVVRQDRRVVLDRFPIRQDGGLCPGNSRRTWGS